MPVFRLKVFPTELPKRHQFSSATGSGTITVMQVSTAFDPVCDPDETSDSSSPTVVVVYDDVPAGQHAIRMLANMFQRVDLQLELLPRLWRFESLEDPDWFAAALAEAMSSDIVVVATSSSNGLNTSVEHWIKQCLKRKRGTNAAIVALLGPAENLDGPKSGRLQFMKKATGEAGLDFFAPTPGCEDSAFSL